jgi:hypothetical protein
MKRMHHKYGVLTVLLFALLFALLLVPAASAATTSHVTVHGHLLDLIWPGTPYYPPTPHYDYTDYVGYGQLERATGQDGGTLVGYLYACLDGTIGGPGDPNSFGNNTSSGDVVILSTEITDWQYLGSFPDLDPDFWGNMDRYDEYWLWTGTWEDGLTHNNHNHQATLSLDGACEDLNGLHADLEWNSMVIDPSLGRAPFTYPLVTPANMTGWITSQ